MRRPSLVISGLLGLVTSLPVMALSYLGQQWAALPFIPFDLFDWLARVLPGAVIRLGIASMVRLITALGLGPISDVAKRLENLQGILLVVAGGAALGVVQALLLRRTRWMGQAVGALTGGAAYLFFFVIEIQLGALARPAAVVGFVWLALLMIGWNVALGMWLAGQAMLFGLPAEPPEARLSRRALLKFTGVSIGTAVVAGGLGGLLALQHQLSGADQPVPLNGGLPPQAPLGPTADTTSPTLAPGAATTAVANRDQFTPVLGTRPEVTPDNLFYRIDIDAAAPQVNGKEWGLNVSGLFDRPRRLTLSDLMAYPAVTQPITLSCISNPVGGDLIGTAYWTGVSLPIVLKDLGLQPEAKALGLGAEDDYYESVELRDMMDPRTLLVYGMNGATLPQAHGYPLRIYIPNRYGMKQPKWIISMVALPQDGPGYWVDRQWSPEAQPQIVSVIDAVTKNPSQEGWASAGGIAWAGDRGIQKVEVQVDQGEWAQAVLRLPPLGPLTWVQWRFDAPVTAGRHVFQVRATDGTGTLQTAKDADTFPNGATGYDSKAVTL